MKDQLGHSSSAITVDLYGHLIPGGNRQAMDRLDTPVNKPLVVADFATSGATDASVRRTNLVRSAEIRQELGREELGWMTGFEPATSGSTIRRSNQLSYTHHAGMKRQQSRENVILAK